MERCRGGNLPPVGFGYDDSRSIPPPIFFSILLKRKRAADRSKRKGRFLRGSRRDGGLPNRFR